MAPTTVSTANTAVQLTKGSGGIGSDSFYLEGKKAILDITDESAFNTHAAVDIVNPAQPDATSACQQMTVFTTGDYLSIQRQISSRELSLLLTLTNDHIEVPMLEGKYNDHLLWLQTKKGWSKPPSLGNWKAENFDYYVMLSDLGVASPFDKTYYIAAFPWSGWEPGSKCSNKCDCERPDAVHADGSTNWTDHRNNAGAGGTKPPSGQTHSGEGPEPSH